MFNNKKDPLVDAVKSVIQKSEQDRQTERLLNESLGIESKKALPHEYHAQYDAMLNEAKALSPKQERFAKLGTVTGKGGHPEKIDPKDLEAARQGHAHKVDLEEDEHLDEASPEARQAVVARAEKIAAQKRKALGPDVDPSSLETKAGKELTDAMGRAATARSGLERRMKPSFGKNVVKESEQLDEKAVSDAQRRFFGLVRGIQKGKAKGSSKAEKAAKEMSVKQVRDYAKTKEKGLPEKKKMNESLEAIQEEIRNTLWEKLDYVYENYGEEAAMEMYASLTEEEQWILNEKSARSGILQGAMNFFKTPTPSIMKQAPAPAPRRFEPTSSIMKNIPAQAPVSPAQRLVADKPIQTAVTGSVVATGGAAALDVANAQKKSDEPEVPKNPVEPRRSEGRGFSGTRNINTAPAAERPAAPPRTETPPPAAPTAPEERENGPSPAPEGPAGPQEYERGKVNLDAARAAQLNRITQPPAPIVSPLGDSPAIAGKSAEKPVPGAAPGAPDNEEQEKGKKKDVPAQVASALSKTVGQELRDVGKEAATPNTEAGRKKIEILDKRKPEPDAFQKATKGDWSGFGQGGS